MNSPTDSFCMDKNMYMCYFLIKGKNKCSNTNHTFLILFFFDFSFLAQLSWKLFHITYGHTSLWLMCMIFYQGMFNFFIRTFDEHWYFQYFVTVKKWIKECPCSYIFKHMGKFIHRIISKKWIPGENGEKEIIPSWGPHPHNLI